METFLSIGHPDVGIPDGTGKKTWYSFQGLS